MLVDWCALAVALVATWFTIRESRRNNSIVLKILEFECAHPTSVHENSCKSFTQLRIIIRNLGLSLHSPAFSLCFRERDGFGSLSMPLKLQGVPIAGPVEFAKGMIADICLKSYEMTEHEKQFLLNLVDCGRQNAKIVVYSDGYRATEIRVGHRSDRFKFWWNRIAFRVNRLFWRRVTIGEQTGLETPEFFPEFMVLEPSLAQFLDALRRPDRN